MDTTLTSKEAVTSDAMATTGTEALATSASQTEATAVAPTRKLKSAKFFYVGLAWAIGYPSTACLIGYLVVLGNGGPPIA